MVAVGVVLRYLHRLELLQPCLLLYLVVALVGIVLKMSHVGDVSDISHLVAQVAHQSHEHVVGHSRPGMSEVGVAIDCRPADVKSNKSRIDRSENFFFP